MAKQRNSLGLLVLPHPGRDYDGNPMTWAEYKALTGIDLEELVTIRLVSDDRYEVNWKPNITKIIALSIYISTMGVPPVILPKFSQVRDEDDESACLVLAGNNADGYGGMTFSIYANKTIIPLEQ